MKSRLHIQFIEQRFCRFEIGGGEALAEQP
jgi:hypothetical protein